MAGRALRDVERVTSRARFVEKLRRLADALGAGQPFTIQVARQRFTVPADADMSVEHERDEKGEELELQLKWKRQGRARPGGSSRRGRRMARPARIHTS